MDEIENLDIGLNEGAPSKLLLLDGFTLDMDVKGALAKPSMLDWIMGT